MSWIMATVLQKRAIFAVGSKHVEFQCQNCGAEAKRITSTTYPSYDFSPKHLIDAKNLYETTNWRLDHYQQTIASQWTMEVLQTILLYDIIPSRRRWRSCGLMLYVAPRLTCKGHVENTKRKHFILQSIIHSSYLTFPVLTSGYTSNRLCSHNGMPFRVSSISAPSKSAYMIVSFSSASLMITAFGLTAMLWPHA
jgi:hypothetical protein